MRTELCSLLAFVWPQAVAHDRRILPWMCGSCGRSYRVAIHVPRIARSQARLIIRVQKDAEDGFNARRILFGIWTNVIT